MSHDLTYRCVTALGWLGMKALGIEVVASGAQHVPRSGPVILAAAHVSYPDFLLIQAVVRSRGRHTRFMTRHDVWQHRVLAGAMDRMQHIAVDRAAPAGAYLHARRLLLEGEAVLSFPEAGVSYSYTVRSLMRGVAGLARETGAPVVPVALWGSQRIWSVGVADGRGRPPRPDLTRGRRVDVTLGEPLTIAPQEDLTDWTRGLGHRLTEMQEGLQGLSHHRPDPGEHAPWHPAHLGGHAPTRLEAAHLDEVPRSAVTPTWGPTWSARGATPPTRRGW